MSAELYAANHPARFWRPLLPSEPRLWEWERAALAAADVLPPAARAATDVEGLLEAVLGEGQFGPGHWRLSPARRLYYRLKPLLPRALVVRARRVVQGGAPASFPLGWPVEDRYRRFLWAAMAAVLAAAGRDEAPFLFFWPGGARWALVLTHDVETAEGQRFVGEVADREERLGLRSSFNFVAERYPLDMGLIDELRSRGFEVGVHGLRHDGHELRSRRSFERTAGRINDHLARLRAVGFRSPLTHRHPEWMQELAVEYDSSFFDTDPFEPMPGGTMSIWPFQMGRFVELPYTLAQDSTLADVRGERGPGTWLEKAAYVERWHGMALVNTHPDYLRLPGRWDVYAELLEHLGARGGWWNALPREAARWWRERAAARTAGALDGGREGVLRRGRGSELEVLPPPAEEAGEAAARLDR
jgi:hypothetical protein